MSHLRRADAVVAGTYVSAMAADSELARLLTEFGHTHSNEGSDDGEDSDETIVVEANLALATKLEQEMLSSTLRHRASQALMKRAELIPVDVSKRESLKLLKASTRPKEKREQGSVKYSVYKEFIKANSYLGVCFYLFTILLQQFLTISTNIWLKDWSESNGETGNNGDLRYYLGVYAALGLGASLVFLANGLILYSFCVIRSAKVMHDRMFHAVMRSPMLFFETTPLGTILNRFSRDVYVIDEILARVFGGFARTLAGVLGMILVITSAAPTFLLVVAPLMFIYKRIQVWNRSLLVIKSY